MKKLNIQAVIAISGLILILLYTIIFLSGLNSKKGFENNTNNRWDNGFALFYQLFNNLEYDVDRWYKRNPPDDNGLFIVINYDLITKKEEYLNNLIDWVENGGKLFLVGFTSNKDPIFEYNTKQTLLKDLTIKDTIQQDVRSFNLGYGKCFDSNVKGEVLISNKDGAILIHEKKGDGEVYLLSDSLLLQNSSMKNENVAILTNNILKKYFHTDIIINEYQNDEKKDPNHLRVLFEGNLFFVTIQLFLIGLFFIAWKGIRFGIPIRYQMYERRSLQEHLNAVGQFYQNSKAIGLMDKINLKYFLFQVERFYRMSFKADRNKFIKKMTQDLSVSESEIELLLTKNSSLKENEFADRRIKRDSLLKELSKKYTKKNI